MGTPLLPTPAVPLVSPPFHGGVTLESAPAPLVVTRYKRVPEPAAILEPIDRDTRQSMAARFIRSTFLVLGEPDGTEKFGGPPVLARQAVELAREIPSQGPLFLEVLLEWYARLCSYCATSPSSPHPSGSYFLRSVCEIPMRMSRYAALVALLAIGPAASVNPFPSPLSADAPPVAATALLRGIVTAVHQRLIVAVSEADVTAAKLLVSRESRHWVCFLV
jgi:hypothetical protein